MTRMLRFALLVGALAAFAAACSPGAAAPTSGACTGSGDVVLCAINNQFDKSNVTAPAGRPFSISFTNQEASPHNVSIARDASFSDRLFEGEVIQNRQIEYSVPALAAGTYAFRCDVHPFMAGTLVAQ